MNHRAMAAVAAGLMLLLSMGAITAYLFVGIAAGVAIALALTEEIKPTDGEDE